MESIIAILTLVPPAISALVALVGFGAAAYKAFKARDYKKGLDASKKTIQGFQALVVLLPESEQKTKLKALLEDMEEAVGGNRDELARGFEKVEKLLKQIGLVTDGDDTAHLPEAGSAVRLWREDKKNG